MSLFLAIDTSTRQTGVALGSGDVLECRRFSPPQNAGEQLLPVINELLTKHGCRVGDLDAVILANGPGSFTGLRIGLATAKGLVFGGRAALVPVPTLEVLAWQAPTRQAHVFPLVEARRGEVFTACWRRNGASLTELEPPRRVEIASLLTELPEDAFLVGPALASQRGAFHVADREIDLADDPDCALSLPWLLQLGARRLERLGGADLDSLEPDYCFDFQPTVGKARA